MTTWTYRRVLRERPVRRLLGAALLARLGEEMFTLALVLHVLATFGSPALAGVAVLASFAPGMLVSPLTGAVLDRFGAMRGIRVDMGVSAAVVAGLAVAPAGHAAPLVVLAAVFSLTTPLGLAGVRAATPRLVPASALERANALDVGSYGVCEVAGPVLVGAFFVVLGGPVTFAVIAALYTGAFLLMLGADEPPRAGRRPEARARLVREALAGVRYVLAHPVLRALVVCYGLYQVAWGVLVVAVPAAVAGTSDEVRAGSVGTGLLWGVVGLVGILAALVVGRVCRPGRERVVIVLGTLAVAVLAVPLMVLAGFAGLAAGLVVVGLAAGSVNVGLLTLRQRRTDPSRLGRVLVISISLNLLGMPVGAALGGAIAARSPGTAFVVAGAAALLAAVTASLLIPREPGERGVATAESWRPAGSAL